MGCVTSCELDSGSIGCTLDDDDKLIISLGNFKLMPYLGIGGSGLVRAAKKLDGRDTSTGFMITK